MGERLRRLYEELDFFLNNSPAVEDCTDEENKMFSDMANLKNSMDDVGCGA